MANVMRLKLGAEFCLDDHTYREVVSRLDEAVKEKQYTHVCLDATDVHRYSDSCFWSMLALAMMVWRRDNVKDMSLKLGLCVPPDRIEVIALTRLDSAVALFPCVEVAMSDLDWKVREVETVPVQLDPPKVSTEHVCHTCRRPL